MKQTLAQQTGHAAGILLRLEHDLARAKRDLRSATRNLIVGAIVLLIGLIALVVYFLLSLKTVAIAAIGLLIGGAMVILALVKTRTAQRLIDTTVDKIADAQAELDGLKAQLPAEE